MKVLVIDDDSGLRRTVSLLLEDEEHTVETAADGDEGLQKSIEWDPDLILTDVRMPGMDGLELLDRLREAGSAALGGLITGLEARKRLVRADFQHTFAAFADHKSLKLYETLFYSD